MRCVKVFLLINLLAFSFPCIAQYEFVENEIDSGSHKNRLTLNLDIGSHYVSNKSVYLSTARYTRLKQLSCCSPFAGYNKTRSPGWQLGLDLNWNITERSSFIIGIMVRDNRFIYTGNRDTIIKYHPYTMGEKFTRIRKDLLIPLYYEYKLGKLYLQFGAKTLILYNDKIKSEYYDGKSNSRDKFGLTKQFQVNPSIQLKYYLRKLKPVFIYAGVDLIDEFLLKQIGIQVVLSTLVG